MIDDPNIGLVGKLRNQSRGYSMHIGASRGPPLWVKFIAAIGFALFLAMLLCIARHGG